MKRQIKFRGKRVDTGEWVYGSLLSLHPDICEIFFVEGVDKHQGVKTAVVKVDPDTVGQFTGLLDKNGKEIYEGDILGFEREKNFEKEIILPFVVKWSDYGNGMVGWTQFTPIEMIVKIGNIHDNPELLKGGKECKY